MVEIFMDDKLGSLAGRSIGDGKIYVESVKTE